MRVAVVGLGGMGSRIGARLADAGYDLIVWNRSPERTAPFVDRGAIAAESPRDAARRADVLITMLADPAALAAVTEGDDGIAAGAHPDLIVVEMSTVGPAAVARLAGALPGGTGLVDAPVLGSLAEVEAGSLSIFAGGETELVDRVAPVLAHLGTVLHIGPGGSGAAAKLVANATLVGVISVIGEAVALGRQLGLDDDAIGRVLGRTALADQAGRRLQAIQADEYPPRFPLSLAHKDADLIHEAAAGLRALEAARSWLADAEGEGKGRLDYSAVLATILEDVRSSPT
jgi:3-hydroxyisobutyrate dehydrogenase-like beta-hydroxyacid dehydrogenase